jgi:outer membrane protein assembly factor BamB
MKWKTMVTATVLCMSCLIPSQSQEVPVLLWEFDAGGQIRSSPAIGEDGTIYFGCQATERRLGQAKLHALRPDGTVRWAYETTGGEISAPPAIDSDGTIYFGTHEFYGFGDYKLYALRPDGTPKWEPFMPDPGMGVASSIAIGADHTIYFGTINYGTGGKLYALRPDRTEVWNLQLPYPYGFSRVIVGSDGTVYAYSQHRGPPYDGQLHAVAPTGQEKWHYYLGCYPGGLSIGLDESVYCTSDMAKLHAVSPDGAANWLFANVGYVITEAVVGPDAMIHLSSANGNLYTFSPEGALVRPPTVLGGLVHATPAIAADGTIYAPSYTDLCAVNPDGTLRWRFPTPAPIQASPAIGADGTVYLGGQSRKLYALQGNSPPATGPWPTFQHDMRRTGRAGGDAEPPVIGDVSVSPSVLWPANHKLVLVTVNYTATDNSGPPVCSLSATSNEPDNGQGDGDTANDIGIIAGDPHHLWLRAERAGNGAGRTYTVTITATDAAGNSSQATVAVSVPKSQGKR